MKKKNPSELPEPEIWAFYQRDAETGDLVEFKTNVPRPDILREFEKEDTNIGNHDYVFCRVGTYWFVKFEKEKALIRPLEGTSYIANALSRQRHSIPIDPLIRAKKGYDPLDMAEAQYQANVQKMSDERLEKERLFSAERLEKEGLFSAEKYEGLTVDEIKKFEALAQKAHKEYEEAKVSGDMKQSEKAWKDFDGVKKYLWSYGLKLNTKKNRSTGNVKIILNPMKRPTADFDKKRIAFKKNTDTVLKELKNVTPLFYKHLKQYLHTGKEIQYDPDPSLAITWYVRM